MGPGAAGRHRRGMSTNIDELVAATPATRDRSVDFLRALSIVVVVLLALGVLGHALERRRCAHDAEPDRRRARRCGSSRGCCRSCRCSSSSAASPTPSRAAAERAQGCVGARPSSRTRLAAIAASRSGVRRGVDGRSKSSRASRSRRTPGVLHWGFVVFVPLWFLGVYSAVVAAHAVHAAPARTRARATLAARRRRSRLVDLVRFHIGVDAVGFVNVLLVFLFVHQLGYFYGDGTFTAPGSQRAWAMALGAVVGRARAHDVRPVPAFDGDRRRRGGQQHAPDDRRASQRSACSKPVSRCCCAPRSTAWLAHRATWKAVVSPTRSR